jgi:hypothetical protein
MVELNADDNEQTFAYLRAMCSVLDQESFMKALIRLGHNRKRIFENAIRSNFRSHHKSKGNRKNKWEPVEFVRNTNCRVADSDSVSLNVPRRNKARQLNTKQSSRLQEKSRNINTNSMAVEKMLR